MAKIIAELCQNHNGDIKILEEMVHAAAESGADYAKIQSMHSTELTHRPRFDEGLIEGGKIKVIKRPFKAEYERLSKLIKTLKEKGILDKDYKNYGTSIIEFSSSPKECKRYANRGYYHSR